MWTWPSSRWSSGCGRVHPRFAGNAAGSRPNEDLQVKVLGEDQPTRASFADARTAMTFQGSVLVTASVYLKHAANTAELLAHELEHILEQLDRVDLQSQAGNGAVWRSDRVSFETRRAVEAGRRAAREIMDAAGSGEPRNDGLGRHGDCADDPQTAGSRCRATVTSRCPCER